MSKQQEQRDERMSRIKPLLRKGLTKKQVAEETGIPLRWIYEHWPARARENDDYLRRVTKSMERRKKVAALVSKGLSAKDIAERIGISKRQVYMLWPKRLELPSVKRHQTLFNEATIAAVEGLRNDLLGVPTIARRLGLKISTVRSILRGFTPVASTKARVLIKSYLQLDPFITGTKLMVAENMSPLYASQAIKEIKGKA